MAFQPATFEEAKARHKPLKRSQIRPVPLKPGSGRTTSLTSGNKRRAVSAKKVRRPKKLTDGQMKKRVWKQFSIYIRTEGADENGFNKCITCDRRLLWTELHAGHFIRGRLNANLFDERGVWPQCYGCNVGAQGNVVVYYKKMLEMFGQEVIDELLEQNNQTRKWRPGELKQLLEKYRSLNAANPLVK